MSDPTIRDQLRNLLVEQVAPNFRVEVPLAVQRQVLDGMGAQSQLPAGTVIERGDLAGFSTEWITAPGASADLVVLHTHGGGYVMGSCASHRSLAAWLSAAAGMQVVLPEYRLAPEHPFPAALEDAVAAYHALLARGVSPSRLAIVGDSAGGGLALATLMALRDAGAPLPAAVVLFSPWSDLTASGESVTTRAGVDPWLVPALLRPFAELYCGAVSLADPRVSPLFGDFAGLPPMLVQVGDQEILLSDSTRVAERARAAGVEVVLEVEPEVWHVFQLLAPTLPEANAALARAGEFLHARLGQ